MESKQGELNKQDWKSIGRGALIALGGALAIYVAALLEVIDWSTVSQYGYLIAPIASIFINALRKWAEGK